MGKDQGRRKARGQGERKGMEKWERKAGRQREREEGEKVSGDRKGRGSKRGTGGRGEGNWR